MRKTKEQKGITLIALIITIIVLLILAVVAIGAVQNDGIIEHAKNARDEYSTAQATENSTIQSYLDKIQQHVATGTGSGEKKSEPTTMEEALKDTMLTKKLNSDVTDKYGNKITVPAGFKILVDTTTGYTSKDDIDVTKGIVIVDSKGNEFVWIPTPKDGKVYTNEEKTEYKTINLDRYKFSGDGTPEPMGNYVIENYYQELATSDYGNATAKDLKGFIESATTKGGYYLARYEAGVINYDSSGNNSTNTVIVAETGKKLEVVSKKNARVWNAVTQNKASEISRNMYTSTKFTSDLVNSYAWDTAIVFIQTFSTEEDASNYSNLCKSQAIVLNTGWSNDKYCNIYEMSGALREWTTETSTYYNWENSKSPCVVRGGYFSERSGFSNCNPKERGNGLVDTYSGSGGDRICF